MLVKKKGRLEVNLTNKKRVTKKKEEIIEFNM